MDKTPKTQRKASLSLGSRINHKRHKASPQGRVRQVFCVDNVGSSVSATSPKSLSISSDAGFECTPPHKKLNLDESLDYSPCAFDSSFSPSGFLSQTLSIESPEVGWKWNRGTVVKFEDGSTTTPDSAYAADSSFTSAGSTDTLNVRIRGEAQQQRFTTAMKRHEEQRKAMELHIHKAEKIKVNEMLKQRCAKLQEQLQDAKPKNNDHYLDNCSVMSSYANEIDQKPYLISCTRNTISLQNICNKDCSKSIILPASSGNNDSFSDFFNDTDADSLLLEATHELELKIVELAQKRSEITKISLNPIDSTTPVAKVSDKTKPSSLYSKFLEDDSPDDWFVSLDEVILQATQKVKSRPSLQRYKSMPVNTVTTTGNYKELTHASTSYAISKNFKRHSSSNTLNSITTSKYCNGPLHINLCPKHKLN